jgi:monoamine oxidase
MAIFTTRRKLLGAVGAAMFQPWGRVHFAGEHLAEVGVGLEAAMESSENEAQAILRQG